MQTRAQTGARFAIASVVVGTFLRGLVCPGVLASDLPLDLTQYAHAAWTAREGLSGSTRSIVQTPDGYLWLGTEFGLVRFDGVRFVRWSPPAGQHLPSNNVLALLAARDGTLWIGTLDGLASWKNGKLTHYPEVADAPIYTLLEDRAGSVWAGCPAKLCAISGSRTECYPIGNGSSEAGSSSLYQNRGGVYSLYEDSEGNLWAGTQRGLWKWKPGPPQYYLEDHFLSSQALVRGDETSGLTFTNGSALAQMAGNTVRGYSLSGVPRPFTPFKLLRDRIGALWIGTLEQGLLRVYQGRTTRFSRSDGLSGTAVTALFEDREGTVWVGTTNGIDRFHEPAVFTITEKQGLSTPAFSVLPTRDGTVWIATRQGLNRWYDGRVTIYRSASAAASSGATGELGARDRHADASGTVRVVMDPQLPENQLESLFEDQRGRIWARTENKGSVWFENGRFRPWRGICASPNAIISDGHSGAWISCPGSGLFHVAGEKVLESFPWPLSSINNDPRVTALLPDPVKGGLWVGFLRGGLQYLKDGRVAASIASKDGLGAGPVWGLYIDHEGTLWAAMEGGLSRVRDGRAATLTAQNGLPCDAVHWVVEDNVSSLWLYTSCGLLRISRSALSAWASGSRTIEMTVLDSDHVSMHVNLNRFTPIVWKAGDGRVWFAHLEGVSVIDPLRVDLNKIPPPVHIEQITADGKQYPVTPGMRLPARVRDVWIDYTALSLIAPEKVRFKYKLEGQDRDWKEVVNDRQAQYSNLSPGKHRFRVIASNNSGVWNESGDTLEFSITPAYYQTGWFRLLVVVTFLTAISSIYRVRVRMLERRHSEVRALNEALQRSETYLAEAQRLSHTGSWVTNIVTGKVTHSSGEHSRLFGFDPAEGLPSFEAFVQRIHPEDRARVLVLFDKATRENVDFEADFRTLLPGGAVKHVHAIGHPAFGPSGAVAEYVGTAIDVTDRKRAEEERERLHQLEGELRRLNRVGIMGELTASIAHEINQPLSGVVSNGSACLRWLARDPPEVEEAREAARRIIGGGQHAGEIIKRLRALTTRVATPREKLNLNETIREVLVLTGDEAKRRGVMIRAQFANDLSLVLGDRVQLQQVVLNLAMNAIEAMSSVDDRPRELMITTRNTKPDEVQVTVEDSGTGLDPNTMDKIFESFYTTKPGGMGMGLSISRSILRAHGGRLWATARNDPGAMFHFTLPIYHKEGSHAGI